MKIYSREKIENKEMFSLMHWDFDMRSFQVDDKMVFLIQIYDIPNWINPEWKELIEGIEEEFLLFLNQESYPLDIPSIDSFEEYIRRGIEAGKIEYTGEFY